MSSPPRRRHKSAPMEEVLVSVGSIRQRLLELDSPPDARKGSRALSLETQGQTWRDGDICQGALIMRQGLPEIDKLPEDMLQHIHSLMPLQDAARAACVSRRFLRSWRCYSNLTINRMTLGETDYNCEGTEIRYINKIGKILNNYSGSEMKVKTLRICLLGCKTLSAPCLDRWMWIAVKSGLNELRLLLPSTMMEKYCFPYSLLFDETNTSSIQSLELFHCIFEPIETLGCFTKLKSLELYCVHITEEGLNQLLSNSSGLEQLQIYLCSEIVCLKIPCTLQKLKFLAVQNLHKMHVVEISAPNVSTFHYNGFPLEISMEIPSQLNNVYLSSFHQSRILSYAPYITPNAKRLTLLSCGENVKTPTLPVKLLHLKSLKIELFRSGGSPYDIFSVLSFIDACPALESFTLHAQRDAIIYNCAAGDDTYLMGESGYQHDHLKRVKISGFHSAKSLIKLVIHILESGPSLESLTLDTTHGFGRKPGDTSKCTASGKSGKCCWMSKKDLEDAEGAMVAVGRYIVGRVPSAVEFKVLEPCRRCYADNEGARAV